MPACPLALHCRKHWTASYVQTSNWMVIRLARRRPMPRNRYADVYELSIAMTHTDVHVDYAGAGACGSCPSGDYVTAIPESTCAPSTIPSRPVRGANL